MATPESATLRACLDYLRLCGIAAWRINVQGVPLHDGSGKYRRAPSVGIADIIGIVTCGAFVGRALAVEVKSQRGRQSDAQAGFQDAWERAGGIYILARSAKDLRDALLMRGVKVK